MSHFAILDENNEVIFVTPIANEKLMVNGKENEQAGVDFLFNKLKITTMYPAAVTAKQTSYNGRMRNKYAGIGDTYDETKDAFISPKPFPSWVFDESGLNWIAPKAMPTQEGKTFVWDESKLDWIEFVRP